jgi:hypothetical protein
MTIDDASNAMRDTAARLCLCASLAARTNGSRRARALARGLVRRAARLLEAGYRLVAGRPAAERFGAVSC